MRVIAHLVASHDEPFLPRVVRRISHWTRDISVVFDGAAIDQDIRDVPEGFAVWKMDARLDRHEGRARTTAWHAMEEMMGPDEGDYIVLLEPDEVVVDHDTLQAKLKVADGGVYPVLLHYMWDENHFRVDGPFRPAPMTAVIPYRRGAQHRNRQVLAGREPAYAHSDHTLVKTNRVIANVLSYGHLAEGYRSRSVGLPDMYLSTKAVTKEWEGGGLL